MRNQSGDGNREVYVGFERVTSSISVWYDAVCSEEVQTFVKKPEK